MALRIELRKSGAPIDGVEEWWDGVEAALDAAEEQYPILDSISPYGEVTIPRKYLTDLAEECRRLRLRSPERIRALLLKIAELSERAVDDPDAELRFDGD
jgi:hypothetical protein